MMQSTMQQKIDEIKSERSKGKRIVFTNGCFDILHRGHVTYLQQARDLGDFLIVGVNSDASVKRLKGTERPVNSLEDRAYVVAALKSVDYVIPFDEDTPLELIKKIMPDILVKGGDYTIDRIVGAQEVMANGGRVEIIPFIPGKSTSAIIEIIKTL
jgi:D-beta-D-heptose 7-phosphate kinase/D-beta-D-heptose 1-phosphate adenosyltransferase